MMKINKKQTNNLCVLKECTLKACKLKISMLCRNTAILLSMSILSPPKYTNNYNGNNNMGNNYQGKVDLRQVIMDRRNEIPNLSQNDLEILTSVIRTQFNSPSCADLIIKIWNMNRNDNRDMNHVQSVQGNVGFFNIGTKMQKGAMPVQFQMPGPENFLVSNDIAVQITSTLDNFLYAHLNVTDQDEYNDYADEDSKFTLSTETSVDSNFTLSASETTEESQFIAIQREKEKRIKAELLAKQKREEEKKKAELLAERKKKGLDLTKPTINQNKKNNKDNSGKSCF